MQVILKKDVEGLGHRGDIVNVANGYYRNYILPKGLGQERKHDLPSNAQLVFLVEMPGNLCDHHGRSISSAGSRKYSHFIS